jgi:DNA-binding XRE family transcriptional regulator
MSNAIKYWRERHEPFISQKELAEQVGIDRPTLSKIENPNIPIDPDEKLAEKIARILGVLVVDILRK